MSYVRLLLSLPVPSPLCFSFSLVLFAVEKIKGRRERRRRGSSSLLYVLPKWNCPRRSPGILIDLLRQRYIIIHTLGRGHRAPHPFRPFMIRERNSRERWERLIYILSNIYIYEFVCLKPDRNLIVHSSHQYRSRFLYIFSLVMFFFLSFFLGCLCIYSLFPAGQQTPPMCRGENHWWMIS